MHTKLDKETHSIPPSQSSTKKQPQVAKAGLVQGMIRIPVRIVFGDKEIAGYTEQFTRDSLFLITDAPLAAGTPLNLQCSFGEMCYLNLSGFLMASQAVGTATIETELKEIKFPGIREWEQKILESALEGLAFNVPAQNKSSLKVSVSKDYLAIEAAYIKKNVPAERYAAAVDLSKDSAAANESSEGSKSSKRVNLKKNKKFTPNPSWVLEMDKYLMPYRQAIWESKLVQGTSSGELSLEQVKGWSIQFYPFIELFPQFMATYLAKATDPMSRGFLIDNLRVEKRHADQWIDMAKGFGVPREELFSTLIIPEVEALTHWMWSITSRGSFVEGVAATNYAIEGVTQGIATIVVKGFMKYHGKHDVFLDKRAYMWMEAHSTYDDIHPYEALEIIKLHASSPEIQQKVVHAAQRSLEYLFRALQACYAAYIPEPRYGETIKLRAI
jgi:pyrroloquinoline quinone (PQQ) biosynthesis protein C